MRGTRLTAAVLVLLSLVFSQAHSSTEAVESSDLNAEAERARNEVVRIKLEIVRVKFCQGISGHCDDVKSLEELEAELFAAKIQQMRAEMLLAGFSEEEIHLALMKSFGEDYKIRLGEAYPAYGVYHVRDAYYGAQAPRVINSRIYTKSILESKFRMPGIRAVTKNGGGYRYGAYFPDGFGVKREFTTGPNKTSSDDDDEDAAGKKRRVMLGRPAFPQTHMHVTEPNRFSFSRDETIAQTSLGDFASEGTTGVKNSFAEGDRSRHQLSVNHLQEHQATVTAFRSHQAMVQAKMLPPLSSASREIKGPERTAVSRRRGASVYTQSSGGSDPPEAKLIPLPQLNEFSIDSTSAPIQGVQMNDRNNDEGSTKEQSSAGVGAYVAATSQSLDGEQGDEKSSGSESDANQIDPIPDVDTGDNDDVSFTAQSTGASPATANNRISSDPSVEVLELHSTPRKPNSTNATVRRAGAHTTVINQPTNTPKPTPTPLPTPTPTFPTPLPTPATSSSLVAPAPHYHGFETFLTDGGEASDVPANLFPHPRDMHSDCKGRFSWKCGQSAGTLRSSDRQVAERRRTKRVNFAARGGERKPTLPVEPQQNFLPLRMRIAKTGSKSKPAITNQLHGASLLRGVDSEARTMLEIQNGAVVADEDLPNLSDD